MHCYITTGTNKKTFYNATSSFMCVTQSSHMKLEVAIENVFLFVLYSAPSTSLVKHFS